MSEINGKGHETSDAKFRPLMWSAATLLALMIFAFSVVFGLFTFLKHREKVSMQPLSPFATEHQLPPGPRLQVAPILDLEHLNVVEDSLLNSYGWSRKEVGEVRIPIDRAMELMLERGFPVRPDYQKWFSENSKMENASREPNIPQESKTKREEPKKEGEGISK